VLGKEIKAFGVTSRGTVFAKPFYSTISHIFIVPLNKQVGKVTKVFRRKFIASVG